MNTPYDFDETQNLLRDSLQRWLDERFPFERRLQLLARPEGLQTLWQGLAQDLGLLGSAFAETAGGAGGGAAEHLLLMQTLGGALAGEPYLGSAVICGGLLQRCGATDRLAALIEGQLRPAWAGHELAGAPRPAGRAEHAAQPRRGLAPERAQVAGAGGAGGDALHRQRIAAGRHRAGLGAGRRAGHRAAATTARWTAAGPAELAFDDVALPADALLGEPGAAAQQALQRTLDEATLALCAEALGVTQRLLDATIDYARQRKQFGQPIGAFQVLQHRIADMHIARRAGRGADLGVAGTA